MCLSLVPAADAAGTSNYTYDSAGRLATDADAASRVTGSYSYDDLNQVTSISYGSGNDTQSFGYDSLHRLTSDTVATASGAQVAAIGYGYDNNDNVTAMTTTGLATPGGGTGTVTNTYGYDQANRMTSWTATPSGGTATTKTYGYDDNGNLVNDNGVTSTYDARNELTAQGNGNSYTYTANGDLATQTSSGGDYSFSSDAYGQQITDGPSSFTWDALNRVVSAGEASNPSYGVTLTYDGQSSQVASDGSASYSRDPAGQITGVDSAAGGRTIALSDQHNDLSGTFTANGTSLSTSTTWDPWGGMLATSGPTIQVGYQGQWTDPVTQQVNMGSRFYRTGVRGFINADAAPGGAGAAVSGLYAYADDNPMSETDPSGHSPSSGGSGGGDVTEAQVNAARARASQAEQIAAQAGSAADGAWQVAGQAQQEATAEAGYARYLNSQASALLRQYNSVEAAAQQAYATANSLDNQAQGLLNQASNLQAKLANDQYLADASGRPAPSSGGSKCHYGVVQAEVGGFVLVPFCTSTGSSGGGTVSPLPLALQLAINSLPGEISNLQSQAQSLYREADSYAGLGNADSQWAAQLHGEYETARAKADAAEGQARADAERAAQDYSWAVHLGQVAGADEQAAIAAEAQYQKLEQEYQQQQEQKKKIKPKPKPAPTPHPTPTPTPAAPAPPKPPKQVQKALQDVANTVVRVAQTAYQVFVQPVISAVTHCISQPSAGSCLQAAATIALALIPELRAEEAGIVAAEEGSQVLLDTSAVRAGSAARSL
jgi:RHS repeat-associated protein